MPDPASRPSDARRFAAAWALGASVATAGFWWMVTAATGNLLRYEPVNSSFYEAQARALLDGRLAIPREALNIEAFEHAGKTYMYFPPLPALMRVPVVAVTDGLDGRLTALSMLAAFVLALGAAGVLLWRVRTLLAGDRVLGRAETVATGLLALLVGLGTPLFFAASRAWVYHEAALWAGAFALCAYDQIVALCSRPTGRRLLRAGGFTLAAILSRVTIGTGPAVALGVVFVVVVAARLLPRLADLARGLGGGALVQRSRGFVAGIAAAAVVPVATYATINYAKFGSLFGVPIDRQAQNFVDPHRRRVLAANGGSLFSVEALPTQALALLRPDAIAFRARFPWVGVPEWRPHVIGDLLFDARQPTTSLPTAMPLLLVLAVVGIVAMVRRSSLAPVRPCAIGAALVLPLTFTILYVAQRYMLDVFPLVFLLAVCGVAVTADALARRSPRVRAGAVAALAVMVVVGSWTGVAVALEYQRVLAPLVSEGQRRQLLDWQSDIAAALGTPPVPVRHGDRLPRPAARGTAFVLGDCDALYVSDGFEWHAVERAAAGGRQRLSVRLPRRPAGTVEPIVAAGEGTAATTVAVEHLGGGRARIVVPSRRVSSRAFPTDPDRAIELDVVFDAPLGLLRVTRDGEEVLASGYDGPAGPFTLGADPAGPGARFAGTITRLPTPTAVCAEIRARAG